MAPEMEQPLLPTLEGGVRATSPSISMVTFNLVKVIIGAGACAASNKDQSVWLLLL